jgi:heat-inducible transcriptional repressor
MESASHVLSQLSRNVGFVVGPELASTAFRHIDMVRLAASRILVVMVSRTGLVTNRVIEIGEEISSDELQTCANYLNTHFAGLTLAAIRARLLQLMSEEKALYDTLLKRVVSLGEQVFETPSGAAEVYLDGTSNILAQREFEDVERMRSLFRTFEQKSRLVTILTACISGEGVRIVIGREHPDPDWHGLSVVAAGSGAEGGALFGLGVMGSTRMEYARMISVVDHVARAFSDSLKELLS